MIICFPDVNEKFIHFINYQNNEMIIEVMHFAIKTVNR